MYCCLVLFWTFQLFQLHFHNWKKNSWELGFLKEAEPGGQRFVSKNWLMGLLRPARPKFVRQVGWLEIQLRVCVAVLRLKSADESRSWRLRQHFYAWSWSRISLVLESLCSLVLQLIGWGSPTLCRVICLTQSNINANDI